MRTLKYYTALLDQVGAEKVAHYIAASSFFNACESYYRDAGRQRSARPSLAASWPAAAEGAAAAAAVLNRLFRLLLLRLLSISYLHYCCCLSFLVFVAASGAQDC